MPIYTERLLPTFWVCAALFPIVPALILVSAPFNVWIGTIVGVLVYLAALIALFVRSINLSVTHEKFIYGNAMVESEYIGAVSAYTGEAARVERGTALDARAYTRFRAFMPGVVKLEITDANDPTPYWLVSTRRPLKLAEALRQVRTTDA
jgi:hypothetical protein